VDWSVLFDATGQTTRGVIHMLKLVLGTACGIWRAGAGIAGRVTAGEDV